MSRSHHDTHELPDGPPPEVLREIDAAWERAQGLPEIHFEADHELRRAFASVLGPDGVRRRITARQAVLTACGDALVDPRIAVPV
jgi:hypothetical protein